MYWIRGKYVSIRTMEESDTADVVRWRNRPEAARWLVQWEPLTEGRHLDWFRRAREREALLVFEDPAGQPIGCGNFYGFDRRGISAEWGRLASAGNLGNPSGLLEGCYLAHRILFELLGFERTYCGTAEPNSASRRFAEFLGYRQEGFRRSHLVAPHGVYNLVEYGLLAGEFRERSSYLGQFFYAGKDAPEFTDEARRAAPECRLRWFNT